MKCKYQCRGKSLDGSWVFGFQKSEDYIVVMYEDGAITEILVDKNTVGLYSGKQDKGEKYIFEGDIIENKNGLKFEVRFGKFAMYCPIDDTMMENVGFYLVADGYYEDMPLGPTEEYATVIGNIQDNTDWKIDGKYRYYDYAI